MKFLRYIQKKRRAMLAMAALTLFANPFTAQASNITTKDGVTLNPTNNVYNIAVQKKLSNSVGVNKFTHFNLDKGQIANMQFDKLNTLANLVDNRININGTVNALRDGKIGGNLYFLSPNGIAVGASGVINAGSFTGMAVDKAYFDKLSGLEDATKFTNALKPENIVYNNDPENGIDIQGVINAPGGISLYATKIDIGKDAVLRTDIEGLDFKKVVNVEGVDSGITGGFDVSYKDGDIVLKAKAEHTATNIKEDTSKDGSKEDSSTKDDSGSKESADVPESSGDSSGSKDDSASKDDSSTKLERITTNEATINVDGTIKSAGNVSINAEAVTKFAVKSSQVATSSDIADSIIGKLKLDCASDFAKKTNTATVNIGKTANIYSAGDMDISAISDLTIQVNASTPNKNNSRYMPSSAVAVISATNKATVNIDGKLESAGRMTINATAKTSLTSNANAAMPTEDDKKDDSSDDKKDDDSGDSSKNVPEDNADSQSDSQSDSKTDSKSDDKESDGNSNYVAVSVIDGETSAEININSGSEIKVGGSDTQDEEGNPVAAFSATAKTENTISSTVTANAGDSSALATAVNIVNYKGSANVNVNSSIETPNGSINIDAVNTFNNDLTSTTTVGKEAAKEAAKKNSDSSSENSDSENSSSENSSSENSSSENSSSESSDSDILTVIKSIIGDSGEKAKTEVEEGNKNLNEKSGSSTLSKIFEGGYFKTGTNVGVFKQENNAKVNIAKNVKLNAANDVSVSATNEIESLKLTVDATINNQNDQNTKSMNGVGVLVSNIQNNADIVNDGNLTSTGGSVNLNASSGMSTNQLELIIEGIKDSFKKVKEQLSGSGDEKTKQSVENYEKNVNENVDKLEKSKDSEDSQDQYEALNDLSKTAADTKELDSASEGTEKKEEKSAISTLKDSVLALVVPSAYSNYYARTVFADTAKADDENAPVLNAAGSFSINSMTNNARVIASENSVVSAENGAVNVNSLAQNRIVSVTGNGGEQLAPNQASKNGAGISVFVGNFKNNPIIALGKNSNVKAGGDIKVTSKDYAKDINVIYSNGKADSTSITGMASYLNAQSNNIISIDNSAKLNTSANLNFDTTSQKYITSVSGGVTLGHGNGKSFGTAVNIVRNDSFATVLIADNGVNQSLGDNISKLQAEIKTLTDEDSLVEKKSELKELTIVKKMQDNLGSDCTKKLGTTSTSEKAELTAQNVSANAKSTGIINSVSVEGTANYTPKKDSDNDSDDENNDSNDDVPKGEAAEDSDENPLTFIVNKVKELFGSKSEEKLPHSEEENADAASDEAGESAGNDDGIDLDVDEERVGSQLNISGAGSVAVNLVSGETGAFITNAKVTADKVDGKANDDVFHGAWAGAGAFNFFGKSQAIENTNVALGGSVAYTDSGKNVDAIIKNSTINTKAIANTANRADTDIAAGMGLAVSKSSSDDEGSNTDVAISASLDFVKGDTHALLINNNVNGGSIENKATINSVQVAGGLDIAASGGGEKGVNIGGTAAASKITNDLQSGIKGGSYENLGKVDITADKKSNQVDVAVAGGVTAGSDTEGFAFGGAVTVSDIKNNSRAFLSDTSKFNSSGTVNIDALDSKNSSSRESYLASRSITIKPTAYLSSSDSGKIDGTNGGGNIVSVAVGGGAGFGDSSASGNAVSYSGLSNLINVDIKNNQDITAQNFNVNSTNKANIVNVAAGLAGSSASFTGAGSAGVSDIKNNATINISNSNVTAENNFLSNSQSNAHIVNVAGQTSLANEFAGGLTFAYNAMKNTTGEQINGGSFSAKNFSAASTNNNYALAVGGGVTFSKDSSALNGAVGLNMGTNSTKAVVDGSTIKNVENLKVTATDNTSKTTVAGGVNISKDGNVAAGGAVAYANIGKANNKEIINATITNAEITTQNSGVIDVEALDNAKMTTVGAGAGASGGVFAFQGAAAVTEVNKDNVAEISNSNITGGTPNIKIISTSGGNGNDGLKFGDDKINVNNKINTVAGVIDIDFTDETWFNGAFAIGVNKFNQSTQANFKNTTRPEIVSKAGNVDIYSNSEADILSVSAGGSGGKASVSTSGSTAYNFVNNSAESLVENANVNASKNFGVVSQSDDKISNYAGAVNINVDGYAPIGVSVALNEIEGNTNANVKNSKLNVSGSDSDLIAISNPNSNLIDGYVTKNTWTSGGLMSGRTTENKSGVVVNSSATHSISSDLATIGIRATSDSPGVAISGTVNINKISGGTNSKVEGTDVSGNADTFVNASDYSNNGSFIGNAAASGTVAVGMLWNENKVDRETNSLVNGGILNVKNLDVKADNRQGISNLNIAVGVGFVASKSQVFAAASGDNVVRNQMEGTTTAKIENATVNHSGAVNVDAYHKDNAFATNIAGGVAVDTSSAGATFDMGYGLMRENSTVQAEINNSTLTSESGAVNVNAENDSKIAGAFGTAGVAVHAGAPGAAIAGAVGINNDYVTNNVHAGIKDSTLNVGAVDVNAKNTSEIKADGGVASVAVNISKAFIAALGSATAVTNGTFDNKVTADVDNSTINAKGDVNINARDDHKSKETVVSAALSTGLAVSVNRMSTSINGGLANLQSGQLGKALSSGDLVMNTDNASKENAYSDSDKLTGEFGDEKRFLNEGNINNLLGGIHANSKETKQSINDTLTKRYSATVNYNNSLGAGVFANVANNSKIDAGENKISIGSTENNDLSITSGTGSGGIIGVGVGSTSIKARRANTANVIGSELNAKNIDISTTNGQTGSDGIESRMYNATLTALGASVGYNNVDTNGTAEILISNSKITAAENLNAKATDNSKSKSYILDAGLKGVGYTGVFAYNTNSAQAGIEVSNKSALNANAINFDAQNHTYRATDTLAISASGLGVQTNTSEAKDESQNFINVTGADNTFTADKLNFNTLNGSQTYAHTNGQAYLGLNAVVAKGLANTNSTAKIAVDDANTFKVGTANLTAQIGEDGKYSAESTGFAINGSAVGVNIDDMIAQTASTAQINIGNEIYNEDTTLNATALNKASRNAFMRNNAYAIVANANDISAYTKAQDDATITVGSDSALANENKLGALNVTANTENKSYVAAKGTGGAIGGDFGSAAHADNDVNNRSEATLKGTWNVAENVNLTANQHDSAYISGYSARGAILTGGKGSLDNVINGSSTATISEGATINAKTVNVNAKNFITTDKYSDEYDYTLFGRMGGVVDDVDYQRSSATTKKTANIDIGKNATITTTGTQIYDAASDYNLKNNVYADGGSLLASLRWVKSHNYITADEKISVGTGANLKNEGGTYEDGGITLAAHDNLEHNPTAKGYSKSGTGGYVRAENLTELNRNQTIDINGTLKSAKDLNLYAGADTDGNKSKVHAYSQAISQVQTLISDGSADVIRKGATNSKVNVQSGAYGQATHNVNVISNAGSEVYENFAFYGSTWSSTSGNDSYKVATSDQGNVTSNDYTHNSRVKVDGELKAANTPNATINISGVALPDGFILTDSTAKNLSYSVTSGDKTVTKRNTDFAGKSSEEIFAQQIYNGISTATTDYPNDYLKKRYEEVEKLLGEYSGDMRAYSALEQEKIALENEMIELGMGSKSGDRFIFGATPSIQIKTVVLPDVEVSGGNINVSTDNFTGSGKLNASGIPKIDVENNSTAYLITKRLTIADKGGSINFNGINVANNAAINNFNSSKSGATFSDVKIADATDIPTIRVSNSYAGQSSIAMKPNPNASGYDTLSNAAKNATYRYTPINYIEVTANVTNPVGKAIINNKQGSIRINSGANVNAQDIEMTAKKSVSQGYTDGIVNIANTPEDTYADEAKKLRAAVGWDSKIPTSDQNKTGESNQLYNDGTGRIAGDAIYIAARDININGLIQAGYNGYKANITQAKVDNATEQTFFNGVSVYKVNDGGSKLGSDGYYVYEPQIYYDKAANKLYVEDINSTGGKVYLSGRILSTGNGKIVVSDGGADIDIKNNTSIDMNVGKVTSSEGSGFIQIVDTAQNKLTQYSSGQTRTIENYSDWLADNTKGKVTIGDGLAFGNASYAPQSGLTYRWAEGTKQTTKYHYHKEEKRGRWGNADDPNYSGRYEDMTNTYNEIGTPENDNNPLGKGTFIDSDNQSANLKMYAQNKSETWYGVDRSAAEYTTSGFFGYYHHHQHYWNKTVGSNRTYIYSLKADYPISVGMIGKGNPTINLANTSTSGGDLYITNNINNTSGTLNISAKGGSIIQDGGTTIMTNNATLRAKNDIKNIDLTSSQFNNAGNSIKLNANSISNAGKIDINVTGNVVVNELESKTGDVSLTATGDIKQTIKGTSVNARNIKLDSANGSINLQIESDGQAGVNVSAISAAANGNITLTKNDNADFRIGSIVSTAGDVTLTAKGKFVDALDKVRDNSDTQISDLIKSWIDMGLIAGTADYKGAYLTRLEKDRDDYKADVTELFTEYKTLLANHQPENEMSDRLTLLDSKFKNYETADAYLAADKDYQALVTTAANPQYQWTQDDLLYGIRSAIVNKQEGTAYDVTRLKDANITGKNVTLTGAGVGSNSGVTTTINMSELGRKDNETPEEATARLAKLKTLSNAEAADVTLNYATDAKGNPITHTVERVNYRYDVDKGYYIDKAGNYIRYRKDTNGGLLKYTYDKDLKQVGDPVAVTNFDDVIESKTTLENKEIKSFEITGTVPLGINATGNITVKTSGNEGNYIVGRNKGVKIDEEQNPNTDSYNALNIVSVETSKADGNFGDVRIIGEAGIFNAADSGANVIAKDLILVGGNGAIGTEKKPFAVQLTGDLLNARSNADINLQKIGADNFRIGAIYTPKNVRLTNSGGGTIQRSSRFDEISEAYINAAGGITLNGSAGTADSPFLILPHENTLLNLSGKDFYIRGVEKGTMTLNNISGNIDISSEGSIGQTQNGNNTLKSIKVAANGDVILDGDKNKFNSINIGAIGGKFSLKNNSKKLTANFGDTITGEVEIKQSGDVALGGKFSGSVLSLASEKGVIESTGALEATKEINLSSETFTHKGEIHTDKLTIATDKGLTINNTENTFNSLEISSRDGKAINGDIEVEIKTDKFAPSIKNDVTGDVTLTNNKAGGLLSFGDGEAINISGNFLAKSEGDFEYGSTLTGKDIEIRANNIYRRAGTNGYFYTDGKIKFNAQNSVGTAENPVLVGNHDKKTDGLDIFGKSYIKGVNDGILTLGDVVTDFVSVGSEGSIVQGDGKDLSVKRIDLSATNDITLTNENNVIDAIGNVTSGGTVTISSLKPLALSGKLDTKNLSLKTDEDITSSADSEVKVTEQFTLNGNDIKLSGKVDANNMDVTTKNGLDMQNAANSLNKVTVKASDGKAINGSVLISDSSDSFTARIVHEVKKDITLTNVNDAGKISLQAQSDGILGAYGNMTLNAGGDLEAVRPLWAAKDINITSRNGKITITNVSNAETLKSLRNIKLDAADLISIQGQINAGNNIDLKSRKNAIAVLEKANVQAGKDINLSITTGDIGIDGSVNSSRGNIKADVGTGGFYVTGKIRANNGNIDIAVGKGNIEIGNKPEENTINAKGNITITADDGSIKIAGKTKSNSGAVSIKTNKKNDTDNTSANVFEAANVPEFYSYDGTPVLFSANVPEVDDLAEEDIIALLAGDIEIDSEIEANDSVTIATLVGNININKQVKVNSGDLDIGTLIGDIKVASNGSANMLSAQNDLNIATGEGSILIAGKVSTKDGDISITSVHDTYKAGQGITVEETGAIKPGRNLYLDAINGDIKFKNVAAKNANIGTINGSVTADTISADDTIRIELESGGDLYLNLAQSKGVAILANNSSNSRVNTIRANTKDVSDAVAVGKVLPYRSSSGITPSINPSSGSSGSSGTSRNALSGSGSAYSVFTNNFTSNRNSFATLGTTYTPNYSGLTYWQSATSAEPNYSFGEFALDDRQTRNYFEVRFVPSWLEREFISIDFDYSFDNFGIRNATEDEIEIS